MLPERRSCLGGLWVLLGLVGCRDAEPPRSAGPRDGQVDSACPAAPVPSAFRRLTHFEYASAIEDVFGITVDVATALPRDEVVEGFDNHAASLGVTDRHVEAYSKLAEELGVRVASHTAHLYGLAGCAGATPECARTLVSAVGSRLFRRPLTEPEVSRLTALFDGDFSEPGFGEGAELVIAALLQSPSFLYRHDQAALAVAAGAGSARSLASPQVLASRLSFLFWSSVPDATLADGAAGGRIESAEDVEREARRLWRDERTKRSLWHFHAQWLELSDFSSIEKNPRLFSFWDDELRRDLELETRHFVTAVAREGEGWLATLLTAPYTYANARLRDFYGLPAGASSEEAFVRVVFSASAPRAGLLTQGAVLSAHAEVDQSSPVVRGKFVGERFFCKLPPPPPPNLAVSSPVLDPRLTTRQRFDRHRSDPACASCHEFLDPIGFGFEHYDANGHYRDVEAGVPIDATGFLAGTDVDGAFDGAIELSTKLAASEDVRRCVVAYWFRYAFGREATQAEACTLDRLADILRASNGNLEELLVGLTQIEAFLR
jgi:hypothetical protein